MEKNLFANINDVLAALETARAKGTLTDVEYEQAASIIDGISGLTGREIYDKLEHDYVLEDAHNHVKEYFKDRDITRKDRHYDESNLRIDYEFLVHRFMDRRDCNVADNTVWDSIIFDHVQELVRKAEAEYDKTYAAMNTARAMARNGSIHGDARDMLIDEQLEQQDRIATAEEAKRKGNIRAYAMVRRAYFYVEANKPQEKEYDAGYFKGGLEAFKSLETILSQGIEEDKLKDVIMKNIDACYAQSLIARSSYEGGFSIGSIGAWSSALETLNGQVGYTIIGGLDDASVVEPLIKDVSALLGRNVEYRLRETKSDTDNYPNLVIYVTREEEDRVIASDIAMSYLYPGIGH
jgi:hypothetical protein